MAVTDQYAFEFHAQASAPSRDYDGRFGQFDFRQHFYGRIGDFDSKEEFEGADRWTSAEDDRLIGGLWANLSDGRCRFVMVKDKRWDWIEGKLN